MPGRTRATPTGLNKNKTEKAAAPFGLAGSRLKSNKTAREEGREIRIPTTKERGNAKLDHEWVSREMAAGRIKIIEDDADVPFEVKMQWEGDAATLGSEFYIPQPEYRCTGRSYVRDERGARIIDNEGNVLTRPCARWRMKGLLVCGAHGGLTDGGRAAAKRRGMEAIDMALGRLIQIINEDKTETGDRLRAIFGLMDRFGMRGTDEVQVTMPQWQQMLKEMWENPTEESIAAGEQIVSEAAAVFAQQEAEAPPPRKRAPRKATKAAVSTPEPARVRAKAAPPKR